MDRIALPPTRLAQRGHIGTTGIPAHGLEATIQGIHQVARRAGARAERGLAAAAAERSLVFLSVQALPHRSAKVTSAAMVGVTRLENEGSSSLSDCAIGGSS